jgi:hypothetical protein
MTRNRNRAESLLKHNEVKPRFPAPANLSLSSVTLSVLCGEKNLRPQRSTEEYGGNDEEQKSRSTRW